MKRVFFSILFIITALPPLYAATYSVGHGGSYDFNTITVALESASVGDTLLVADGNYTVATGESFPLFLKEGVDLLREDAGTLPRIIGDRMTTVLYAVNIEDYNTTIDGFHISAGAGVSLGNRQGGGIFCRDANLTFANCVITNNNADWGGGVYCYLASPQFVRCTIHHNEGEGFRFKNCKPHLINCTVTANSSTGVYADDSEPLLLNSIVWWHPMDLEYSRGHQPQALHCIIGAGDFYGIDGNLYYPPMFADMEGGDFSLTADSPGIDRGIDIGLDFVGTAPDIGALESNLSNPPPLPTPSDVVVGQGETYETLTQALRNVSPGSLLRLNEAVYSETGGEQLPLINYGVSMMPNMADENVTLIGDSNSPIIIFPFIDSSHDYTIENLRFTEGAPGLLINKSGPFISDCIIERNSKHGIHTYNAFPKVKHCVIRNNRTVKGGGGLYCLGGAPDFNNCLILDNSHTGQSSNSGGGASFDSFCQATLHNCVISGNEANDGGGVSCSMYSNVRFYSCRFENNTASGHAFSSGGGLYALGSSAPLLVNCIFTGNSARKGGGVCALLSTPKLMNSTIVNNTAEDGRHIGGGGLYAESKDPTVTNCIFWQNTPEQIKSSNATPAVSFCDVEGGYTGDNNIDNDPLFIDIAGDWHLQPASPCIDAGTAEDAPMYDFDGETRPNPDTNMVDIGADEYYTGLETPTPSPTVTPDATKTPTPEPQALPMIAMAGYWDTSLKPVQGTLQRIRIIAIIVDDYQDVRILGPNGSELLFDDGLHNDFGVGDGIYGLSVETAEALPPGQVLLSFTPEKNGVMDLTWPYLEVVPGN